MPNAPRPGTADAASRWPVDPLTALGVAGGEQPRWRLGSGRRSLRPGPATRIGAVALDSSRRQRPSTELARSSARQRCMQQCAAHEVQRIAAPRGRLARTHERADAGQRGRREITDPPYCSGGQHQLRATGTAVEEVPESTLQSRGDAWLPPCGSASAASSRSKATSCAAVAGGTECPPPAGLIPGVWESCEGRGDAGRRGAGRKAHDSTCVPLCKRHHQASRFPRAWTQDQRRAWLRAALVYTQACARAAGVVVPIDPAPMAEYPTIAADPSQVMLADAAEPTAHHARLA